MCDGARLTVGEERGVRSARAFVVRGLDDIPEMQGSPSTWRDSGG